MTRDASSLAIPKRAASNISPWMGHDWHFYRCRASNHAVKEAGGRLVAFAASS
jgi:hypothetical protein